MNLLGHAPILSNALTKAGLPSAFPPTPPFDNQHLDGVMWQALLIYGTKSNSNSNGNSNGNGNNLGNLIRISRVAFRKSVEKHLMGRLCDFLIVYSVQQAHVCVWRGSRGGRGSVPASFVAQRRCGFAFNFVVNFRCQRIINT